MCVDCMPIRCLRVRDVRPFVQPDRQAGDDADARGSKAEAGPSPLMFVV